MNRTCVPSRTSSFPSRSKRSSWLIDDLGDDHTRCTVAPTRWSGPCCRRSQPPWPHGVERDRRNHEFPALSRPVLTPSELLLPAGWDSDPSTTPVSSSDEHRPHPDECL